MPQAPTLKREFYSRPVLQVARDLIGATLTVDGCGGQIVEVEAYREDDPAAHSYRGMTPRNAVMFGPPGYAYVYRSYGLHWCVNAVCEAEGRASAVLIRALAPTQGLAAMRKRRGGVDDGLLCAGPGRLCQALGINSDHNGRALDTAPFTLRARMRPVTIITGPRIGITKATEKPWRFALKGSPYLSRPLA